jgi:hypothetical protein
MYIQKRYWRSILGRLIKRMAIWVTVELFFCRVKIQRPELNIQGSIGNF